MPKVGIPLALLDGSASEGLKLEVDLETLSTALVEAGKDFYRRAGFLVQAAISARSSLPIRCHC